MDAADNKDVPSTVREVTVDAIKDLAEMVSRRSVAHRRIDVLSKCDGERILDPLKEFVLGEGDTALADDIRSALIRHLKRCAADLDGRLLAAGVRVALPQPKTGCDTRFAV